MVAEMDQKLGSAGRFRDVNAQFAAELLRQCLDDLHASWIEIERKLVIPTDADGAVSSHDKFRVNEEKGSTPEPLAGLFPLGFPLSKPQEVATIDFFLPRWAQYIGSPMLSALYGVWAAWRGNRRQSLQLFEEGYAKFMTGRFLQTMEYRPDKFPEQPKAGPFFANLGAWPPWNTGHWKGL
jgi:protein-glucosylgalactosylhydroxylysine glucosidase